LHSERLLDHFQHPRNAGELPGPAVSAEAANPVCGDTLRLWVQWQDGRVSRVTYKARGCTSSIACGSALTELMFDKTPEELKSITQNDITTEVGGLANESLHAAALCIDAVKAILVKSNL